MIDYLHARRGHRAYENYPYGGTCTASGTAQTGRLYTDQRAETAALGALYDYGARHYDTCLNRWLSPDSIVPSAGNPQALNRYSYVLGNPLKYTDASGHCPNGEAGEECRELQQQAQEMYKIRMSGDWSKDELARLIDALEAVVRASGDIHVFQTIWGNYDFRRVHDPIVPEGAVPWVSGPINSPYAGLTL